MRSRGEGGRRKVHSGAVAAVTAMQEHAQQVTEQLQSEVRAA